MSYLVLARKWRPRRFAELVGQEHVVRALGNALDSGRVHHAFLFTGTRGVGKTTIARIFAKSLNCERGVSAQPCGECSACREIDAGRFVDLLEIDAASRTKVDDTRELLENVIYAPTRGRYKVYLIDEVHMLSTHSFNALLKTLEEPPEHVKFLLATTDPQKLPVTVLSRCLQFNLKRLTEEQIAGQLQAILAAEDIQSEPGSIAPIARSADGSLRDALSLLDQAIAFGNGALTEADVRAMLGTVDRSQVQGLLDALVAGDGAALLAAVDAFAAFALDYGAALEELASLLHRIQLHQLVPAERDDAPALAAHAAALAPEQVQLWYQMALTGRRDLPLAPTPRIGFEMALLRMLAFRPAAGQEPVEPPGERPVPRSAGVPTTPRRAQGAQPADAGPRAVPTPPPPGPGGAHAVPARVPAAPVPADRGSRSGDASVPSAAGSGAFPLRDTEDWLALLRTAELSGPVRGVAADAVFVSWSGSTLRLALPAPLQAVCNEGLLAEFSRALAPQLGVAPRIQLADPADQRGGESLGARERNERARRQQAAEDAFLADPAVRGLMDQYGARPVPDSIRPQDEV